MAENPQADDLKSYRLYVLKSDGHIQNGEWVGFTDDAAAIAYMQSKLDGHALELWDGNRFIQRLEPIPARINS